MCSRTLTMLLSMGLIAASEPQPSASSALDLQLVAPAECPSAARVTAAVNGLVHSAPAQPLVVRAEIVRRGSSYVLEAHVGAGERQLQGETCDAVAQALIAIAALAIDPSARLSAWAFPELDSNASGQSVDGADAASTVEPAPVTSGASQPPPAPRRHASRRPDHGDARPKFGASVLGLGEWGALPRPSYGATGLVRVSFRSWSAELGGGWLQRRWVEVSDAPERKGGYVSWFSLQGNGCRSLGRSVAGCMGVEVGQMTGEGQGVAHEDTGRALWLAAASSVVGRVPLGDGVSLEARATAAFPLYRPEFSIEPYSALHRASWLSGRLSMGIGFH